jgi:hypothetical protein
LEQSNDGENNFEANGIRDENYEAPPIITKRLEANGDYLFIRGLKKTFGDFQAVRDLNIKMYDS